MWLRPLGDMLSEVFDALLATGGEVTYVRASELDLNLPIEVRFRMRGEDAEFFADVPVWRWRTDFDRPLGRLHVRWEESEI